MTTAFPGFRFAAASVGVPRDRREEVAHAFAHALAVAAGIVARRPVGAAPVPARVLISGGSSGVGVAHERLVDGNSAAQSRGFAHLAHLGGFALVSAFALGLAGCAAERGTIGAVLAQKDDHTLVVREAPQGLAAAKAGVEVGDDILLIEGRDVRGMSPADVHRALSGEVGEPVKLTLVRADRVVRVTLRRSPAQKSALVPRKE